MVVDGGILRPRLVVRRCTCGGVVSAFICFFLSLFQPIVFPVLCVRGWRSECGVCLSPNRFGTVGIGDKRVRCLRKTLADAIGRGRLQAQQRDLACRGGSGGSNGGGLIWVFTWKRHLCVCVRATANPECVHGTCFRTEGGPARRRRGRASPRPVRQCRRRRNPHQNPQHHHRRRCRRPPHQRGRNP